MTRSGLGTESARERVESVVDHQLGVVEVQAGEDLVLGEVVVRDDEVREEIDLRDLALLLVAGQEKEELRSGSAEPFFLL